METLWQWWVWLCLLFNEQHMPLSIIDLYPNLICQLQLWQLYVYTLLSINFLRTTLFAEQLSCLLCKMEKKIDLINDCCSIVFRRGMCCPKLLMWLSHVNMVLVPRILTVFDRKWPRRQSSDRNIHDHNFLLKFSYFAFENFISLPVLYGNS